MAFRLTITWKTNRDAYNHFITGACDLLLVIF